MRAIRLAVRSVSNRVANVQARGRASLRESTYGSCSHKILFQDIEAANI